MANEFVARNGVIAQNNSVVSGSLVVTNGITGSLFGTSSQALTASYSITSSVAYSGTGSFTGSFIGVITGSLFGTSSQATSASYAFTASSASTAFSASYAQTSSFANNFTVANQLTAQTLVVSTISSSVVYSSGSNIFGNSLSNTQTFTGSILATGSVNLNNTLYVSGSSVGINRLPITNLHVYNPSGSPALDEIVRIENQGSFSGSLRFYVGSINARGGDIRYYEGSTLYSATHHDVNRLDYITYGAYPINFNPNQVVRFTVQSNGNIGVGNWTYPAVPLSYFHVAYSPPASSSIGTLSLGGGYFNGQIGSGSFSGSASGSSIAINELGTFGGNLIDLQVSGSSKFKVTSTGTVTIVSGLTTSGSTSLTGSLTLIGNEIITGSSTATLGYTGSLFGTASWAQNSSTSSYVLNAVSSSYAFTASSAINASASLTSISASYALTASFALNGGGGVSFPYTGSAQITGSLGVTGSLSVTGNTGGTVFSSNADTLVITGSLIITGSGATITGSLNVSNGITGSLFGTASQAVTASYALTASYVASIAGLSTSQIATGSITASVSLGSGSFAVTSGSSTFLFVSSSGNVGIGTTSPSKKLSVQTTTGADAINWTDGTRNGYLYVDGAGVGIFSGVAASGQGIYMNNTSTYLELWTNSTNRVRIDSTGNVGIGNTSPNALLDVSGSVRYTNGLSGTGSVNISGSLTVTGSITTNGTITAQTLVVQTITSSIEYSSGSNIFGSQLTDRQTMTGSINMTGSLNLYGNQNITGSLNVSGSLTLASASLNYQHNLSVTAGGYQVIVSAATGSYRCAFFDYVMFSGSIVRGGTVTSTWSGSSTEYYENYTADLGGSTSGVTLQTALSTGNIQLQASASTAAWTIRSLIRLL